MDDLLEHLFKKHFGDEISFNGMTSQEKTERFARAAKEMVKLNKT